MNVNQEFLLARLRVAQGYAASCDKALREINAMAQRSRRSIAQRARRMIEKVPVTAKVQRSGRGYIPARFEISSVNLNESWLMQSSVDGINSRWIERIKKWVPQPHANDEPYVNSTRETN